MFGKMVSNPEMLTERELEEVTAVFKSFETGLREATIDPKVRAFKRNNMFHTYVCCRPVSWTGQVNISQNLFHDLSFYDPTDPAMKINF